MKEGDADLMNDLLAETSSPIYDSFNPSREKRGLATVGSEKREIGLYHFELPSESFSPSRGRIKYFSFVYLRLLKQRARACFLTSYAVCLLPPSLPLLEP